MMEKGLNRKMESRLDEVRHDSKSRRFTLITINYKKMYVKR